MKTLERILIGAGLIVTSLLSISLDSRLSSINTVCAQEQRSKRERIIGKFTDINSRDGAGEFVETKNEEGIAINIATDLNYDEHLRFVNINNRMAYKINIKEFSQNYEAGKKYKITFGGQHYKIWFAYEKGIETFYLSSKNFWDFDEPLSFSLDKLHYKRNCLIVEDKVGFSADNFFKGVDTLKIKSNGKVIASFPKEIYYNNYYIGNQGNFGSDEGSGSFTFWLKPEGDDVFEMPDKPVAVTYLGPRKPGSTSTPFMLGGKFYHMVYNAESSYRTYDSDLYKWELEELK